MPILNLIDTSDIERWDTGVSDESPGTVTDITVRADASVVAATFATTAARLEHGVTGTFRDPFKLGDTLIGPGQRFRIASVFSSENGGQFFSLTDEDHIFALGFTGPLPPTGKPIRLRTTDRRSLDALHDSEQDELICFTPAALILCENGPRRASEIQPGDKVRTADRGLQQVRWRGETVLSHEQLTAKPHLRPVILRKNSISVGVPARDITVSPNHRIMINSWRAELLFGEKEVLATAGAMVNENTIARADPDGPLHYIHLKFIHHEILFANGLQADSFLPTDASISALPESQRDALLAGFPALRSDPVAANGLAARRLLKPEETRLLVERTGR